MGVELARAVRVEVDEARRDYEPSRVDLDLAHVGIREKQGYS